MTDPGVAPTKLVRCRTEFEAETIASALRGEGVEARVIGGAAGGFRGETPANTWVIVHRDDGPRALEMLKRMRDEAKHLDWSQVDVGEFEDEG